MRTSAIFEDWLSHKCIDKAEHITGMKNADDGPADDGPADDGPADGNYSLSDSVKLDADYVDESQGTDDEGVADDVDGSVAGGTEIEVPYISEASSGMRSDWF